MARILVRELDKKVVENLKAQARQSRRSLQAEVKIILENAAQSYTPMLSREEALAKIMELREQLKGREFPDSVELIREDRDR